MKDKIFSKKWLLKASKLSVRGRLTLFFRPTITYTDKTHGYVFYFKTIKRKIYVIKDPSKL